MSLWKMQLILYTMSVVTLFYISISVVAAGKVVNIYQHGRNSCDLNVTLDGSEVGDCTSGFMSQDRMDAVLNNIEISQVVMFK